MPFLPVLCRHLLGEELKIPVGRDVVVRPEGSANYVDRASRPARHQAAFAHLGSEPVFGALTRPKARARSAKIERAGRFRRAGAGRPVDGADLDRREREQPRPLVMRAYRGQAGGGYVVMPGGLTRCRPRRTG